jgi:glyoxylase-like metal-dependent hydrolase (beta-lactamase superfamily II)
MAVQIPLSDDARTHDQIGEERVREILPDVAYRRLTMVNVVFIGPAGAPDRGWVMVDTGLIGFGATIFDAAVARFGAKSRPAAIIQTHGHFDHVGALEDLAESWDCPVFCHKLEAPYLSGQKDYPPPDVAAGGGLMPKIAPLLPRGPVDVSTRLQMLPEDHSVPFLSGWEWLHAPGHTEGHISLWRAADRMLVAGDAIVTTGQESAYEVVVQEAEMHGPPRYFTPDWIAAEASVQQLAALEPETVVTGHGRAMQGEEMRRALHELARDFRQIAVPASRQ